MTYYTLIPNTDILRSKIDVFTMTENDEFAWIEPLRKKTREIQEETKRIREEKERLKSIKTEKPPAYLTQESPWNKL